jgi:hypothetical protein
MVVIRSWAMTILQFFSHTFTAQFNPVSCVNQPIQYGIGNGAFPNYIVPIGHRKLTCDNGSHSAMTILNNIEQIQTLLGIQGFEAKIVKN